MPAGSNPAADAAVRASERPSPYSFAAIKEAFSDFLADDALTQAAAVAYYTALSFAPLLVLTVIVVGSVMGDATKQKMVDEMQKLMGPGAGDAVTQILEAQENEEKGNPASKIAGGGFDIFTGVFGLAALIYSASGVFAQLQAAMNTIWDVEPKPGAGLWDWLRKRLLSMGVVFSILFLLLASLAVTAILNVVLSAAGDGSVMDVVWQVINFVVSLLVYTVLFAIIFKYLPDVKIPLKAVMLGAAITAVLFAVGKWGISLYLSRGDVGGGYGGAGGIIVLLVWVYYSAIIVFLGAEFTQVWAKYSGYRIRPDSHAQRETPKEKEVATDHEDGTAAHETTPA